MPYKQRISPYAELRMAANLPDPTGLEIAVGHSVSLPRQADHKDAGKPDLTLLAVLPYEAAIEVAKVMEFGAEKYGWNNWRGGMKWRRITASTLRHVFAWLQGEDIDKESGLHHLAHAACDILFALHYTIHKVGEDDRIKDQQEQNENYATDNDIL